MNSSYSNPRIWKKWKLKDRRRWHLEDRETTRDFSTIPPKIFELYVYSQCPETYRSPDGLLPISEPPDSRYYLIELSVLVDEEGRVPLEEIGSRGLKTRLGMADDEGNLKETEQGGLDRSIRVEFRELSKKTRSNNVRKRNY